MDWFADMEQVITGKTRIVGIIGSPISHSLSPIMHNAAFAACSLDFLYVPFLVAPGNLCQAVAGLEALGVCGFNVTIPHKTSIIPFLDSLDESAEAAGAVNTVVIGDTGLVGYNTDGDGLVDSLLEDLDFIPSCDPIAVIGAGGAARGAIAALCRAGAKQIIISNRSTDKAVNIIRDFAVRYPTVEFSVMEINDIELASVSLLLNTTSLGMNGEEIPGADVRLLSVRAKVYDMVYSNSATPWVSNASSRGLRAVNGFGMLVAQGERAFELWTGVKPPNGIMRRSLEIFRK